MTARAQARMLGACLAALCAAGLIAWAAQRARAQTYDPPVVARVTLNSRTEVERFVALGLDLLETREGNDLFFLTTIGQVQQLGAQGWRVSVDDAQTATLNRVRPDTFMSGYRSVSEMRAFVNAAAAAYPTLTQVFTYGLSWQGGELFGIRLGNRQISGTKPTFFLMAAIHPRELSTSELAMRFVDYLLSRYGVDGDATWLLDEQQVVVVPVANPDGRLLAEQGFYQRKNVDDGSGGGCLVPPQIGNQYGTDLNRNSSFKWSVTGSSSFPCDETFHGASAVSEPETAALQDLIRSIFPDQRGPTDSDAAPISTTGILITLHSYGDLVLRPWGWTYAASPNESALAAIGQKFASYNGYLSEPSIDLYPTSGTTDDWAYGELGIAAFTFEVGPGSGTCGGFMPPYSCLDGDASGSFWPRNLPAFLHAARIARAPYLLAPGPTVESLTASPGAPGQVVLQAQISAGGAVSAAEYYVDTPPWRGGEARRMTSLDGASTMVGAALMPSGRKLVYVRAQDASGNWGPVRAVWASAFSYASWLPWVGR